MGRTIAGGKDLFSEPPSFGQIFEDGFKHQQQNMQQQQHYAGKPDLDVDKGNSPPFKTIPECAPHQLPPAGSTSSSSIDGSRQPVQWDPSMRTTSISILSKQNNEYHAFMASSHTHGNSFDLVPSKPHQNTNNPIIHQSPYSGGLEPQRASLFELGSGNNSQSHLELHPGMLGMPMQSPINRMPQHEIHNETHRVLHQEISHQTPQHCNPNDMTRGSSNLSWSQLPVPLHEPNFGGSGLRISPPREVSPHYVPPEPYVSPHELDHTSQYDMYEPLLEQSQRTSQHIQSSQTRSQKPYPANQHMHTPLTQRRASFGSPNYHYGSPSSTNTSPFMNDSCYYSPRMPHTRETIEVPFPVSYQVTASMPDTTSSVPSSSGISPTAFPPFCSNSISSTRSAVSLSSLTVKPSQSKLVTKARSKALNRMGFKAPARGGSKASSRAASRVNSNAAQLPPMGTSAASSADDDEGNSSPDETSSGDRRAKRCPICDKKLRRDFTRHMRIHDTKSEFRCLFSRKKCTHEHGRFNRPYEYKKHMMRSHFEIDGPTQVDVGSLSLNEKLQLSGRCACGYYAHSVDAWLEVHIRYLQCPLLESAQDDNATRPSRPTRKNG